MDHITEALRKPFPAESVGWKPQSVRGNRALAVAYIDARDVEDRLDAVFGPANWQDSYDLLPNNSVVCTLRVRFPDTQEWIEKCDVGSQSDQPDEGDRVKSAFSDSLKRAAVKLGIGRYLYSLPQQWCDYDPQKRQFTQTPKLPDWALPRPAQVKDPSAGTPLPSSGDYITKPQADNIRHQIGRRDEELRKDGLRVSRKKFLDLFGVDSLEKIPAGSLNRALEASRAPGKDLLISAEDKKPAPVA